MCSSFLLAIRLMLNGLVLWTSCARAFAPPARMPRFAAPVRTAASTAAAPLHVVANYHPEMEEINKQDKSSNSNSWREVTGGYLPNLNKTTSNKQRVAVAERNNIEKVVSLADYKRVVVDEYDRMTVVRFYAPWCRACKAVAPRFKKLALDYPGVNFVEVPVRKDNAALLTGLGVPSLPFGHIYHPDVGLVEEHKINKKLFGKFEMILETYVAGSCPVTYQDDLGDDLPPLQ